MGHNRRYEAQYDALSDERIARAATAPITLPVQAYGPQPIEWAPRGSAPEVNVWVSWPEGPATRIHATAAGWNDRVVIVEWEAPGGRRSIVVWRNAVTRTGPSA